MVENQIVSQTEDCFEQCDSGLVRQESDPEEHDAAEMQEAKESGLKPPDSSAGSGFENFVSGLMDSYKSRFKKADSQKSESRKSDESDSEAPKDIETGYQRLEIMQYARSQSTGSTASLYESTRQLTVSATRTLAGEAAAKTVDEAFRDPGKIQQWYKQAVDAAQKAQELANLQAQNKAAGSAGENPAEAKPAGSALQTPGEIKAVIAQAELLPSAAQSPNGSPQLQIPGEQVKTNLNSVLAAQEPIKQVNPLQYPATEITSTPVLIGAGLTNASSIGYRVQTLSEAVITIAGLYRTETTVHPLEIVRNAAGSIETLASKPANSIPVKEEKSNLQATAFEGEKNNLPNDKKTNATIVDAAIKPVQPDALMQAKVAERAQDNDHRALLSATQAAAGADPARPANIFQSSNLARLTISETKGAVGSFTALPHPVSSEANPAANCNLVNHKITVEQNLNQERTTATTLVKFDNSASSKQMDIAGLRIQTADSRNQNLQTLQQNSTQQILRLPTQEGKWSAQLQAADLRAPLASRTDTTQSTIISGPARIHSGSESRTAEQIRPTTLRLSGLLSSENTLPIHASAQHKQQGRYMIAEISLALVLAAGGVRRLLPAQTDTRESGTKGGGNCKSSKIGRELSQSYKQDKGSESRTSKFKLKSSEQDSRLLKTIKLNRLDSLKTLQTRELPILNSRTANPSALTACGSAVLCVENGLAEIISMEKTVENLIDAAREFIDFADPFEQFASLANNEQKKKTLSEYRESQDSTEFSGDTGPDDSEDERKQNRKTVLQRPHCLIAEGQTLTDIAEEHYSDPYIAWLIADLNAGNCQEYWMEGKRIVEFQVRQQLILPVWQDIVEFYGSMPPKARPENLITVVASTQIDREAVDSVLGPIVAGVRTENASSRNMKSGTLQLN